MITHWQYPFHETCYVTSYVSIYDESSTNTWFRFLFCISVRLYDPPSSVSSSLWSQRLFTNTLKLLMNEKQSLFTITYFSSCRIYCRLNQGTTRYVHQFPFLIRHSKTTYIYFTYIDNSSYQTLKFFCTYYYKYMFCTVNGHITENREKPSIGLYHITREFRKKNLALVLQWETVISRHFPVTSSFPEEKDQDYDVKLKWS